MNDLPKQLRITAGMISMCERIAFGSDCALMDEAADEIEALTAQVEQLQKLMTVWKDPAARDAEVAAKAYINALLTHTDEPESWCSSQADNYVSQLRQAAKGGE